MKLYLVRHGEAMNIQDNTQRPLSENGQKEAQILARFLHQNSIKVDQIYNSGKLRAAETAQALAIAIDPIPHIEVMPGLAPEDQVKPIAVYCNTWNEDVMLVGHLPFLGKLVSALLVESEDKVCIDFHTAAMVCLERNSIFQWCLKWFVHPRLLDHLE